jgi:hypothetical protein
LPPPQKPAEEKKTEEGRGKWPKRKGGGEGCVPSPSQTQHNKRKKEEPKLLGEPKLLEKVSLEEAMDIN